LPQGNNYIGKSFIVQAPGPNGSGLTQTFNLAMIRRGFNPCVSAAEPCNPQLKNSQGCFK